MFPATAALAWAVLAYICIDFGFLNKVVEISPGSEQIWRAGTEIALAATFVVFLFTYLNLNRWHGHFSYGALVLDRRAGADLRRRRARSRGRLRRRAAVLRAAPRSSASG